MTEAAIRVLLTLDSDSPDPDALRAVAALSEAGGLEITALYVVDEDLLKAARLPGSTEVSVATGEVLSLSAERVEAQMVGQAERAQRVLESSARSLNVKCTFRIARGRAVEVVTEAAMTSDIVVVSRALRQSGLRSRRGSHFESLIRSHRNLLFVNEPWASGTSVIVLCESAPDACRRALSVAARIAEREGLRLLTVVQKDAPVDGSIPGEVKRLDTWTEDAVAALAEAEDARLLVLAPTEQLDWRGVLVNMVDRVRCSLLRLD